MSWDLSLVGRGPGCGPTEFQAQPWIQGQLGFQGHMGPKTGLQDGGIKLGNLLTNDYFGGGGQGATG